MNESIAIQSASAHNAGVPINRQVQELGILLIFLFTAILILLNTKD